MNFTRGALLAGGFRTHHQLIAMSADDQRNTLIVEMANHSNQTNYQAFSDSDLSGVGALMVFLLKAGIRTAAQLKPISADDQRNIMIVEINGSTNLGKSLQGHSNIDLVALGLGQNPPGVSLEPSSFIRGVLLAGGFRTHHQLIAMSAPDQRNTLIVEMAGHSNQPVAHFQSLNDFQLAGAGAAMVFLLMGGIRNASQLKTLSDDDQRNIAIVEVDGQTHLGGALQGLSTLDVVAIALGMSPAISQPAVKSICRFLDPPGSPGVGIKSYGLKRDGARKSQLQWSLAGAPPGLSPAAAQTTLQSAFNVWTAPGVAPTLTFQNVRMGGDIQIGVANLGALTPAGLTIGKTNDDGTTINFTNQATFATRLPGRPSYLAVAAHEIGHALGLLHSTNPASIMFPVNSGETLDPEDIAAIRALYSWTSPFPIPGIGTESSPALCACGNTLVMAWRGVGDDDDIWTARSGDGVNWTPQHKVPGAASADGPTLAWDGRQVWLGLRGIPGDDGLYWATSGDLGNNWSNVSGIPGVGSSAGPSMTVFNGVPLLVWRGIPGDDALFYTTWNNPWAPQAAIPGTGSADRPAVCVDFAGVPRMVWLGIPGDDNLYTTSQTGAGGVRFWQPQQLVQWVEAGNGTAGTVGIGTPASSVGPSVTTSGGKVLLTWQGIPGDDRVFYTQGAPGTGGSPPIEWSTQAAVPGAATSHRPAIAAMGGRVFLVWKGIPGDTAIYTASV
ncbi:MAG: matrixin family metalloprotease [Bryobacteraceae bacterium]